MRPKSTFYASENLRRIYRERVGGSMTQKQFAIQHDIGGQSMLAQILSGAKPLPIETAPKLAKALRCTIDEICPEMAAFVRGELLPTLGKSLRRVAAVLLAIAVFHQPSDAIGHNAYSKEHFFAKSLVYLHIVTQRLLARILTIFQTPVAIS